MRTKKADLVVKILFVAILVILSGLLIAWMTGAFKDKKQDLNNGMEKIDSTMGSVADFDLLAYDGMPISGEAVMNLIKEYNDKSIPLAIRVITLAGSNYYNYDVATSNLGSSLGAPSFSTNKAATSYITPTGDFKGSVLRNANDEIYCIEFKQQK